MGSTPTILSLGHQHWIYTPQCHTSAVTFVFHQCLVRHLAPLAPLHPNCHLESLKMLECLFPPTRRSPAPLDTQEEAAAYEANMAPEAEREPEFQRGLTGEVDVGTWQVYLHCNSCCESLRNGLRSHNSPYKYLAGNALFVLRMGVFHTICSLLGIIVKRFLDAGLRDLADESKVITEGSVDRVLNGQQYNRGVHLHNFFYEALKRLAWKGFLDWFQKNQAAEQQCLLEDSGILFVSLHSQPPRKTWIAFFTIHFLLSCLICSSSIFHSCSLTGDLWHSFGCRTLTWSRHFFI